MKTGLRIFIGCLLIQMTSLGGLLADDTATNSRQGYPIPVSWEVARLVCSGYTLALCMSHDGQTLYSANGDGQVTAWDLKSLTKKLDLPGGVSNNIERLVLSNDDSRLASCSGTAVVHVWDTKTGKLIHESHPSENYADVAISPDGKTILTSGLDNPVRLIDIDSGKVLNEFKLPDVSLGKPGRRDGLWNLAFLDDSKYGVGNGTSGAGGSYVFETATGQVKAKLGAESIIGLDATQKWLIAKSGAFFVLWSLADIKKACADPMVGLVPSVSIPNAGGAQEAALTTISFDHWNVGNSDPAQAKVIDPRHGFVWPLYGDEPPGPNAGPTAISPDGKFLYQAWHGNVIRVLDLTKRPKATRWLTGGYNHSFAVDAERGLLATGNLVAWDRNTGLPVGCGESGRPPYADCVYWQNGIPFELIQILNAKPNKPSGPFGMPPADPVTLEKINLQTREVVKKFTLQANAHITVGRTGKLIVVAYDSPPVHWKTPPDPKDPRAFFNPANMETEPALQLLDGDLKPLGKNFETPSDRGFLKAQISPLDKFVIAQSYGGGSESQTTLTVFEVATGKQKSATPLVLDRVTSFGVTDDGFVLATTVSGSVSCFRADTGEKVATVELAHRHPIQNLAISPDCKTVVTTGSDNLIKLWNLPDLKPKGILEAAGTPGTNGLPTAGFYDDANLIVIPDFQPSPLCSVSINQTFDESKWNVNASAGSSSCLAISQDGKQVALGELGGVLTVVDNVSGKQLYSVPAHSGGVTMVEFVKDTYQIKTHGADGKSLTWDLATSSNPISETTEQPTFPVISIQTGTGPKKIFQSTVGNGLTVSPSAGPYQEGNISPNYSFGFEKACVIPGDAYLALSSWPELYIYSLKTERLVWAYDMPSPVAGIVYDPLHQQLISTHIDGVTRRWELPAWAKSSETR